MFGDDSAHEIKAWLIDLFKHRLQDLAALIEARPADNGLGIEVHQAEVSLMSDQGEEVGPEVAELGVVMLKPDKPVVNSRPTNRSEPGGIAGNRMFAVTRQVACHGEEALTLPRKGLKGGHIAIELLVPIACVDLELDEKLEVIVIARESKVNEAKVSGLVEDMQLGATDQFARDFSESLTGALARGRFEENLGQFTGEAGAVGTKGGNDLRQLGLIARPAKCTENVRDRALDIHRAHGRNLPSSINCCSRPSLDPWCGPDADELTGTDPSGSMNDLNLDDESRTS